MKTVTHTEISGSSPINDNIWDYFSCIKLWSAVIIFCFKSLIPYSRINIWDNLTSTAFDIGFNDLQTIEGFLKYYLYYVRLMKRYIQYYKIFCVCCLSFTLFLWRNLVKFNLTFLSKTHDILSHRKTSMFLILENVSNFFSVCYPFCLFET